MKKNIENLEDKPLKIVNYIFLTIIAIITIYPPLFILVSSLSSGSAVARGEVFLWPVEFTLSAYKVIFTDFIFWTSYGNTMFYMLFGTLFSMAVSILAAYSLAKKRLPHRRLFNFLLAFTIWFTTISNPVL